MGCKEDFLSASQRNGMIAGRLVLFCVAIAAIKYLTSYDVNSVAVGICIGLGVLLVEDIVWRITRKRRLQ